MSPKLLLSFLSIALLSSCCKKQSEPQEGDLIFVVASSSDFSQAINDATYQSDDLSFDHVAMIVEDNGKLGVLEASSRHGVIFSPWDDFMSNVDSVNGSPAIVIKRLHIDYPLSETVSRAKSHLGEPYDWSFLPGNGKMYCSELIYDSYRSADGKPLFEAQPMRFRDANGDMPDYWVKLFEKLGEPIPEGVPGTNPNDMSHSPLLTTIHTPTGM